MPWSENYPGQYGRMHQLLKEHGVLPRSAPFNGDHPEWDTETGHHLYVTNTPGHGWNLSVVHMGDPGGAGLGVPLGHDDEQAAGRVAAEMRHPETLGHMRDQFLRASLNNDPTGRNWQARRVPSATGGWTELNHYGS